ncbi:MAG: hypothetical protein RLN72_06060 [Henriciella sp.]
MKKKEDIRDPGQPVIISTSDSPIEGKLQELEKAFAIWRVGQGNFSCQRVNLDEVFNDATSPADEDNYKRLIGSLLRSNLAVIDLSVSDASHYVMGLRHALSNNPTLCLSAGTPSSRLCNTRFTSGARNYIDVNSDTWLEQARVCCATVGKPLERSWENDPHASQLFTVRPTEEPFKASGCDENGWHLIVNGDRVSHPKILIFEGNIAAANCFDIWVNSENIQMEMARFWDRSISARIRQLGAVNIGKPGEDRRKDALGLALAEEMGTRTTVDVGKVFMTMTDPASKLNACNKVECVAHVASTIPNETTYGFDSGGKIRECVKNIFAGIKSFGDKHRPKSGLRLNSVLIPLLGSGDGGTHPALVAHQIVATLADLIRDPKQRKDLGLDEIDSVGLLAYFPSHKAYIERELETYGFRPEGSSG